MVRHLAKEESGMGIVGAAAAGGTTTIVVTTVLDAADKVMNGVGARVVVIN